MSDVITIRKKPIEIQAVRWTGDAGSAVAVYKFTEGNVRFSGERNLEIYDELHDSWIKVKLGDYVLRGLKGEFYPHDGSLLWDAYDLV